MSAPRAVSQSCQTLASLSFLVRETDARVMLSPPELLLLGCSRFSFSTRWLSRCLAAAPLAQLFAAAAAGETVAVLLASCVLLLSVAGACAGTVIVLCAVAVAELSVAAAVGETFTVLLSGYLFLFSVAGACSCMFFFVLLFSSGDSPPTVLALESGRSPHAEVQRPVPLERCRVLLRC